MKQIEQNAQKNVCKILIGNKNDKEDRKVSYEQGRDLAKEFNMKFYETSAKTNNNITEAFYELTKDILNSDIKNLKIGKGIKLDDKDKDEKNDKSRCCK